jgi:hypothetical protein
VDDATSRIDALLRGMDTVMLTLDHSNVAGLYSQGKSFFCCSLANQMYIQWVATITVVALAWAAMQCAALVLRSLDALSGMQGMRQQHDALLNDACCMLLQQHMSSKAYSVSQATTQLYLSSWIRAKFTHHCANFPTHNTHHALVCVPAPFILQTTAAVSGPTAAGTMAQGQVPAPAQAVCLHQPRARLAQAAGPPRSCSQWTATAARLWRSSVWEGRHCIRASLLSKWARL